MDLHAWLAVVNALANAYAVSQGKDTRALGYLRVATGIAAGKRATDAELAEMMEEYNTKVANQTQTTPEELAELDARLAARSAAIQAA
jgi:hypothetical protein